MTGYKPEYEPEFEGKKGNHPYVWYLVLMTALLGFLVLMAYLAWTNGWIPQR
jgi:hypothetical protein